MDRTHRMRHALAIAACSCAVARPERSWSSVAAQHPADSAACLSAPPGRPRTPSADERLGPELQERAGELRGCRRSQGEVAQGETLAADLRKSGLCPADSLAFAQTLRPALDPRRTRPGDGHGVLLDPGGRPAELTCRRSPAEREAHQQWAPRWGERPDGLGRPDRVVLAGGE